MTDTAALLPQEVFDRIVGAVESWMPKLRAVSEFLHANPELNFQEFAAHDALTALLAEAGFEVERSAFGLDTAFAATAGTAGPLVAVLCEYDALEGVGHACGHNVIAAAGVGAGIGAAAVADALGGRVTVLGSPAEEGGGGKIAMLEAGAFHDVAAAMMIHPADRDLTAMDTIAVAQLRATYTGVAAHAAAAPERGKNALDAAVLGYMNIAALRQHIAATERIHGIFVEAGEAANVVPKRAVADWMVRAETSGALEVLMERVHTCLLAGADAAGCSVTIEETAQRYSEMHDNGPLLETFGAHSARLGRSLAVPTPATKVMGSTDMGNVSHVVPTIHPMVKVAPSGVAIHTTAFADAAISPAAELAIRDAAISMAATVASLWSSSELRDDVAAALHDG